MSKRRRKARGRTGELPLDSPNWMPAAEAHRLLTGLLGNGYLAAKDLTAAVADKRLSCMRRAIASRIAPDQDREIVPLSIRFDFDHEKLRVWEWKDDAPVYYRGPAPVFGPADAAPLGAWVYIDAADAAFFVRRPEFEKIWPALAASAAPHAASSARDDEPTPATTASIDDKPQRRRPGPQPELRWRTALARELIRRARAGEPEPTAEQMCELVQEKSGKPDVRTVQKEMKNLLS